MGDAVPVGAAIGPRILECRIEVAAQLDVECDRGMFGRVEAHLDGAQRFDDAVVNRPDVGARRVGRQSPPGPHRPLFGAATHTGGSVENPAVGVLADAEDDLQRVVARMRDCPDLLRPRWIRLGDGGERVDDLVGEQFIFGDQTAVIC